MKNIIHVTVGPLGVNCYIVSDQESGRAIIFDPGGNPEKILKALTASGLTPVAIALTHAHFDHIGAVPALVERLGLPVWCPPGDRGIYASPANAMPPWFSAVQGLPPLSDEPLPEFGFRILETPGHTPGGSCYYFPEEKFVLTGDTLFAGTRGRTDFPGGNETALMRSIREVLFALPRTTRIYPGHGPESTIGTEMLDPAYGMDER